jgi:integrase
LLESEATVQAKITKQAVEGVVPAPRTQFLWDTEIKGFGVKITPAGVRSYLVQYRLAGRGSPTRRFTIGRHGSPWTADEARKAALRILVRVVDGIDPGQAKAEARREITVAALCDLYLDEGCATKKAGTVVNDRSRIARHIKPLLGRKRVSEVKRGDIERVLRDVAIGKTRKNEKAGPRARIIVRGGRGVANRVIETLGSIFTFAVNHDLRADNPVRGIKKFAPRRIERFLTLAELARLGDALTTAEQEGENPSAIAAIRLLMLTGCRRGEILSLQWKHVDLEHGCLRLPDSKTGAKVVPLGEIVVQLLASLPRLQDNPHVLPGARDGGHLIGLHKAWRRVQATAKLEGLRIHDLRHSFASVAVANGESLFLVGRVLGHKQARTTQIYAHVHDDPLRAVADRASSSIAVAMAAGGHASAEAVGKK